MPKQFFAKFIVFSLGLVLFTGCSALTQTKSLKLAHGLDVTHPVHKGMEYMAQKLAEKSSGQLTIEIYPSQQLGTERQCLEWIASSGTKGDHARRNHRTERNEVAGFEVDRQGSPGSQGQAIHGANDGRVLVDRLGQRARLHGRCGRW